jgi:hypothetical protein
MRFHVDACTVQVLLLFSVCMRTYYTSYMQFEYSLVCALTAVYANC